MSDEIDITGLDKAAVLLALYNGSRPQGFGLLAAAGAPDLTIEEVREALKTQTYFDYVRGRPLKVDLSGDSFDPWLYDRDNGRFAATRAVATVRALATTEAPHD